MTALVDIRRSQLLGDISRAVAMLVAVEDVLLESDDPVLQRMRHRVSLAIEVLEPVL
jgi:uncharacterized protein HemX